jgi:hypothetical protein
MSNCQCQCPFLCQLHCFLKLPPDLKSAQNFGYFDACIDLFREKKFAIRRDPFFFFHEYTKSAIHTKVEKTYFVFLSQDASPRLKMHGRTAVLKITAP